MEKGSSKLQRPPNDAISRVRFAPESNNLLVSSWDCTLSLYDANNSCLRNRFSSGFPILDCCFESETVALSVGSDCFVHRYDFHMGNESTLGNHDDLAICVEYSKETCQAISGGLDNKLRFWDTRMGYGCVGHLQIADAQVECMSLIGLHLTVAAGVSVHMYDLRSLNDPIQIRESCSIYHKKCIRTFPNGQGYILGSVEGQVELEFFAMSETSQANRYAFRCHPKSINGRHHLVAVNGIDLHPSYNTFITGDNEGYAIAWDGKSRRRLYEFPKFPASVASLSYNHDGEMLAVASSHTYQEANEKELPPEIYVFNVDDDLVRPFSSRTSK
ncbi:mitotic checkpoint protein BUB3.3 isoform X1 [Amborella trichopoda]|uniref:Uncharacterized protein n=1 Tax=Amborella trichopoda TaxID=13333 RepID=W1PFN1_AMBTC|nr:mitotic checkpoint protein BUB3.3 isoform X1 [Amborella trichopoda]ERN06524.1 hypothetical protein AMTR_s00058p00096230 [Amborella trichopoda]|eukprot:XP_020523298.1 mitotic checkpoint protein BUB3.3 isoform X1 [Amborella trichopoda]